MVEAATMRAGVAAQNEFDEAAASANYPATVASAFRAKPVNAGTQKAAPNIFTRLLEDAAANINRMTAPTPGATAAKPSLFARAKNYIHNKTSPTTATITLENGIAVEKNASRLSFFTKNFGKVGKFLGKIAIPLTALVGIFQTGAEIKRRDGHAAAKTAGSTIGGIAAFIAADALIGTVIFPGIGTLAGIGVGIAMSIAATWIGSTVVDTAVGGTLDKHLKANAPEPASAQQIRQRAIEQLRAGEEQTPNSHFAQDYLRQRDRGVRQV